MSQIRNALVIACSLAAVSGVAHADDHAVVKRLSTHGKLTSSHAKQLTNKVSERMARAADAPPAMIEPLRAALSQALLGTPMPPDGISAAKVRLKLYAGLNEFSLEALFAPHPGAISSCERDLDLQSKECEALVAAAGETSLAQAKRSGGGPAPAPVAMAPMRGAQPIAANGRFGGQPQQQGYGGQPQQGSRFGGAPAQQPQQGSRFGGAAAPVAAQQPPPQQQQPQQGSRFGGNQPPQQARFASQAPVQAAPAAAPAYVAATPQPAAAEVSPGDVASRKAEYAAKQEARMARMKAEFEARRQRTLGGLPGDAPPDVAHPVSNVAGPAAEAKPAAAEAPAPKVAAAKPAAGKKAEKADVMDEPLAEPENALDKDMKAAVGGKETAAPAASGGGKAGLDGDFLDGLLDDPTGGKKK